MKGRTLLEVMPMFHIGDKIVYPMHGAGVIEEITEKEILGKRKKYYILKFPIGDMKVMVPVGKVDQIGVRPVIDKSRVAEVFSILNGEPDEMSDNWNKRYRENMDKIKSGDICQVANVVRNLTARDREKGLSTAEKKLLTNARHIMVSELVLTNTFSAEEIEAKLDELAGASR
jgi:CarD family transcriptional regulator